METSVVTFLALVVLVALFNINLGIVFKEEAEKLEYNEIMEEKLK